MPKEGNSSIQIMHCMVRLRSKTTKTSIFVWAVKLNDFATTCYRIILSIKRKLALRNVKQDQLIWLIQQQQLHFFRGHILRQPEDELVKKYTLFHARHGKRKIGRPKLMFYQYTTYCNCDQRGPLTITRRDPADSTRQEGVEKAHGRLQCSRLMMMAEKQIYTELLLM